MALEVEPLSSTEDVQAVSRDQAWRRRAIELARDIRTDPARWAAAILRYNSSGAIRQLLVPSSAVALESVSQRTAVLTVETASVGMCTTIAG